MKNYLIKITPLEPYTFGGERGFTYNGVDDNGTYYMGSKEIPEQTTILGTLRYLLLKSEGVLKSPPNYSNYEKTKNARICGGDTFQFESDKEQSLGFIEEVSPLFIMDKQENIYIPNPFCNIGKDGKLQLMKMTEGVECSLGNGFAFPENSEAGYEAKKGYGSGFLCISDDKLSNVKKTEDIFTKQLISGNNISQTDDAYFKREVFVMKEGMSFAVYLTLSDEAKDLSESNIIYMGKKNSAFKFETQQINDKNESLDRKVEAFFIKRNMSNSWSYCLSDVFVEEIKYSNFAIVETKKLRNLKTEYKDKGFSRSRQKRYELIKAGSCFYGFQEIKSNYNLSKFGYNHIIQIGGK